MFVRMYGEPERSAEYHGYGIWHFWHENETLVAVGKAAVGKLCT